MADYATALSLPESIADAWLKELGPEEAAALGATLSTRAPVTLRVNAQRCTAEELVARLEKEGVKSTLGSIEGSVLLQQRANLPALKAFRAGWFEIQDEASQRLCAAIPLHAGQSVLDLCAGSGGKSLALASRGARVAATDVRPGALQELAKRAKRAGAKVRIGRSHPADFVLVDAPCSGTGRLRREPALRWRLADRDFTNTHTLQRKLLAQGASLVRPGGVLIYATCSLLAAENDQPTPSGWTLLERQTLWPHRDNTDGFHWSMWRR